MADKYIRKQDAIYALDKEYRYGADIDRCGLAKAFKAIESLEPADVVTYSIEPDGTLIITVPKGTKRIGRILIEEDGTQYGGLFYPDTGGCFLSSMERSEKDG